MAKMNYHPSISKHANYKLVESEMKLKKQYYVKLTFSC